MPDQIIQLSSLGILGEQLFFAHISPIVATRVNECIAKMLIQLQIDYTKKKVDVTDVIDMCNKVMIACKAEMGIGLLKNARKIQVKYRSATLHDIEVENLHQQVETQVAAMLKTIAVKQKQLEPMDVEELLGIHDEKGAALGVHFGDQILRKWNRARAKWDTTKKARTTQNAEEMQTLVRTTAASQTLSDETWRVEKAVLNQLSGPAAEIRARAKVHTWFPTKDVPQDLVAVTLVTAELNKSSVKYLPRAVLDSYRQILTWLTALSTGAEVKISSAHMVPMCQAAATKLPFFLRVSVEQAAGEPQKMLTSQEAIDHLCAELIRKDGSGAAELPDIEQIVKYKWLVKPDMKLNVQCTIEKVLEKDKTKSAASSAVSSAAGSAASSSAKSSKLVVAKKKAESFFDCAA